MEKTFSSKIPKFAIKMDKLVTGTTSLLQEDEIFDKQMTEAKNHKLTNSGSKKVIWATCLRAYSKLAGGKQESVFR